MITYLDKFTIEQKNIFKDITGNTIEELESEINASGSQAWSIILSNQKFIEAPALNSKGLHIYRILLSYNIYSNRIPTVENDEDKPNGYIDYPKMFANNGFIYIRNFVTDENLEYLKSVVDDMRTNSQPSRNLNFTDAIRDPQANAFFQSLLGVPHFGSDGDNGYPRTQMWHYKHTTDDPQYKWHTDTFQPTLKCWLYIDKITEENGALSLVPQSSLPVSNRIAWDYERSLDPNAKDKSFRLSEFGTEEDEEQAIKDNGFDDPITMQGPANTFIALNTYGFHKRGKSQPGVERNSLSLQYRPMAFSDYKS
jgi:hypothetical protein